jgi:hypothetical protein
LFPSAPPSTNEHDLRNERISTRIFIILLILSLIILLLYNSLVNTTITINREKPNLQQYKQLYEKYSQTLTCPCTKISTNYKEFFQVNYTLHQLCTSVFVTEEWFLYLARISLHQPLYHDDFLLLGVSIFQALNTLCQMANRTISNSLTQFYSNQYVSAIVTSSDTFLSNIQPLVDQFISSTTNNFLTSFDLIRNATAVNEIMSASQSNYYFVSASNNSTGVVSASYYACSCYRSVKCVKPYPVKNHPMSGPKFYIPDFYYGCYIIESLLQSTLKCFYDQICISQIQSYITYTSPMNVTPLDSSLPSQYLINATVQDLVDDLMIENWNQSITYENYYHHCQPKHCTYTGVSISNGTDYFFEFYPYAS